MIERSNHKARLLKSIIICNLKWMSDSTITLLQLRNGSNLGFQFFRNGSNLGLKKLQYREYIYEDIEIVGSIALK